MLLSSRGIYSGANYINAIDGVDATIFGGGKAGREEVVQSSGTCSADEVEGSLKGTPANPKDQKPTFTFSIASVLGDGLPTSSSGLGRNEHGDDECAICFEECDDKSKYRLPCPQNCVEKFVKI